MDVEQGAVKRKHRGRLYALSAEGEWEDTGTGFVSIVGSGDGRRLVFHEEESGTLLHDRPVFDSGVYELKGEGERQTIIVWEDIETRKDWALSFEDPDGTAEIWEAICGDAAADEKRVLPLPTLANLSELCCMLTCVPPSLREAIAAECMSAKFLNGLRDTFHTAEDVCSEEALVALWQITKAIFLLSNPRLTERYLKQDVYEDVLGMLEHDVGLPSGKRIRHREVLKAQVRFKNVLTFEDAEALDRIHLNYRLQYLKDIALPRLLDDAAFVSLTQMIHMNLSMILDHLQKSERLLEQLFSQIGQKDQQSLHFLQDVCRLAKQIAPSERQSLHEKLVAHRMFALLVPFFCEPAVGGELPMRHICVELLLLSAQNDPSHLRRFLTADGSSDGRALLSALISTVHMGNDQGVQGQAAELLKLVMDLTLLEARDRDQCLDAFYDRGVLDELSSALRSDAKHAMDQCALFGQQLSCELLAFAVMHHSFRARVYVMRHGVVQHALRLLSAPQRFLQLAPVRLLQAAVGSKDEAYHRYLVKCGFFTPLLRAFEQSVRPPALGGNLLVSAVLQVMEYIRIENIKILVDHICRKHEELLREYAPKYRTLQLFLVKHQQNLEYEAFPPERHAAGAPAESSRGGASRSGRMRSPGREDSDDDEGYFETLEDDEEDNARRATEAGKSAAPAAPQKPSEGRAGGHDSSAAPPAHGCDGAAAPGAPGLGLQRLLGPYADDDKDDGANGEYGASCASTSGKKAREAAEAPEGEGSNGVAAAPVAATADAAASPSSPGRPAMPEARPPEAAEANCGVARVPDRPPEVAADGCGAAEKAMNHAPKRLKTSAAAVEATPA